MSAMPKFFGFAIVGAKGQIVIPSEARKAMNIKSGDKLIIMSGPPHHKRMMTLAPEEEFAKFLKMFEEHITTVRKKYLKDQSKTSKAKK